MPTSPDPKPSFEPFIPPGALMREFSVRAVVTGTILGMIFGASSLYLTLKVGLSVSASIPVAVISLTLFRLLSRFGIRDSTILEHNIAQTAGSSGESLAFGVGVTMPAINNNLVNLVKTTTLGYAIAVPELLYMSSQIWSEQVNVPSMMMVLLVTYVVIVGVINQVMQWLEARMRIPGFGQ